jgi:hypothetical protein
MSVVYLEGDSVKECKEGEEQNRKGRQQHRMTQVIIHGCWSFVLLGPSRRCKGHVSALSTRAGEPGDFLTEYQGGFHF